MGKQPWLLHPRTETWFICLPPFLCVGIIFLFPTFFQSTQVNTLWWVALILIVDVGHVYSTLYRTYFDKQQWLQHKPILIAIPILCFLTALLVYQFGSVLFWRIMAYTAVFHFIRQQYGLMKVYQRKETTDLQIKSAVWMVYASMLYPLVYWHCKGPFQFNWFTSDDFIFIPSNYIEYIARVLYGIILLWFGFETMRVWMQKQYVNIPLLLIVTGRALNWFFGIVYFKSDLSFTLLNVISHGIPYITLVWLFTAKQSKDTRKARYTFQQLLISRYGLFIFLAIPLLLGFLEEGCWDAFVWKDHPEVFHWFYGIPSDTIAAIQGWVIPLLITPQLTHYIVDGFIWKISKGHLATT